jgi:hypothetical protein
VRGEDDAAQSLCYPSTGYELVFEREEQRGRKRQEDVFRLVSIEYHRPRKPPIRPLCDGVKLGDARETVRRALGKPTIVFDADEEMGDEAMDVYKVQSSLLSFRYDGRGNVRTAAIYADERAK